MRGFSRLTRLERRFKIVGRFAKGVDAVLGTRLAILSDEVADRNSRLRVSGFGG